MIKGYSEVYLSSTMENIGNMIDFAVNELHKDIDTFISDYVNSDIAYGIETGNPYYLNKQGTELVYIIYDYLPYITMEDRGIYNGKSKEYWLGYSIAYYQWYSQYKFSTLFNAVKASELLMLYDTLHEADVMKFCELMDIKVKESQTQLQKLRLKAGLSQTELANLSGIKLRTIKSYEQRESDINKAQINQIRGLSLILGCKLEDLLE